MTGRCAAWERASVWAISRSKPVAITVTLTISPSDSSMLAPEDDVRVFVSLLLNEARRLFHFLQLACRGRRRC